MLFADITLIDEEFECKEHQWVGVLGDKIAYIGDAAPENAADYGEVYDGAGRLLMPGLYNLHAHAPMTLLRGYAENLPLQEWLNNMIWPYEAKMNGEDGYWATLLACAEMNRYGCVSFSDMYYFTLERAKAVVESGMKANLCTCPLAFEAKPISEFPCYAEMEEGIADLNGKANGRMRFEGCVHAEYTNNDVTCASIVEWAKKNNVGLHIHLSETASEVEECKARHNGMTPVQWFDSMGAFDVPVTAAHCVWVDEEDIKLMAAKGVTVVHNPASNMKLASGFAPIAEMMDAGMNVCLGTDSVASNNSHDMFQDMYLMALLPKGKNLDPTLVTPQQVLRAATVNGAKAQGRFDCGLVKEGYKADLCVLDITGPQWCPANDLLVGVVYSGSGSDVVLTMCDGAVVYREGVWPVIDIETVKAEVAARTKRIQEELKA